MRKNLFFLTKRTFDILVSLISILVLFFPMLVLALAIKLDSKGPVFFKQSRFGKNKKTFIILKFRSMYIDADPNVPTHLLTNPNHCITKVGKFIRKTSLDELPQLFNIFVGHMSFVGPRPALWNQTDLILERDKNGANKVRPGLTGLAQIKGRDKIDNCSKANYDGEYIKRMSLFFDTYIILKTIPAVFKHKDFSN